MIPHGVILSTVLTLPGRLCTLQGRPPEVTGVSSVDSDVGIEPSLFSMCRFEVIRSLALF